MQQSYRDHLQKILANIVVGEYWVFPEEEYSSYMNSIGRRAVRFPALYQTESWREIQNLRKKGVQPTDWVDERMVEMLEKLQNDFQL
jgi:hypothetical protein